MEIWLDTVNAAVIKDAAQMGILHGITTNPSIAGASGLCLEELLENLLTLQPGPVTVQVTTTKSETMLVQARALHALSPRIMVKIPVSAEGLKAIHALGQEGIATMATAIFDSNQILLAARAGATYLAPYFSKICENDVDGLDVFKSMLRLLRHYNFPSKLLAASLQSAEQLRECAEVGAHAVTLKDRVFQEFVQEHPSTTECIERFAKDWSGAVPPKLLPL